MIAPSELERGYQLTLNNALRFFGAANALKEYPDKALALAQLGQEEVGRTLTLLAGFGLEANESAWQWFWEGFTDHTVKAHRAYLYEIISPLRLEARRSDRSRYAGFPLRQKLSQEKEAGFYVDFDRATNIFISPEAGVTAEEALLRISTLSYLLITADAVRRVIQHTDTEFRFCVFGEIALRLCTGAVYQQDMLQISTGVRRRSKRHQDISMTSMSR